MHHLYPSGKGDPLCPLGFHPQVRWPTRCKRCFRDYKEHGGKHREAETLRKDTTTASSPNIGLTEANAKSKSWQSNANLADGASASASVSSSKDPSLNNTSAGATHSVQLKYAGARTSPSSWTSTPDLSHLENGPASNPTMTFTLPSRKKAVTSSKTFDGGDKYYDPPSASVNSSSRNKVPTAPIPEKPMRLQIKEVKTLEDTSSNDVQFFIHVKPKSPGIKVREVQSTPVVNSPQPMAKSLHHYESEELLRLKRELETTKSKVQLLEKEKSNILLRRLTAIDTAKGNTSEVIKLQQRCNELQMKLDEHKDEKKSLSAKLRDLECTLESRATPQPTQKTMEELKSKLAAAEMLCEELMDENEDMKKEMRDLEYEMEEMQDNFREDQADEYTTVKKELEQTTKNCRILSFKLRKTERKLEQIETEKTQVDTKVKEATRMSRESLIRGNSQDDASQVTRDLHDALEREADLREQLKFAEEEAQTLRKSASRIEEDNETLMTQLKKVSNRTPRGDSIIVEPKLTLKPKIRRTTPDEKKTVAKSSDPINNNNLSDLDLNLKRQLESLEKEMDILRAKVQTLETENDKLCAENKKVTLLKGAKRSEKTADSKNAELLQKELSDVKRKLADLETNNTQNAKSEINVQLVNLIKNHKQKMPTEISTKLQLKNMVTDLEKEFGQLLKEVDANLQNNETLANLSKLTEENDKLSKDFKSSQDMIDQLNKSILDMKTANMKTVASLEEANSILQTQNKSAESKIEKLENTSKQLAALKDSVEVKDKEVLKLKKEIKEHDAAAKDNEKKKLETSRVAFEKELKSKEAEIQELRSKIAMLESAGNVPQKIASVKSEYESKMKNLDKQINELKSNIDNMTAKYEILEEESLLTKAKLVSEKEALSSQIHTYKTTIKKLETGLSEADLKEKQFLAHIKELKDRVSRDQDMNNQETENLKTMVEERQHEVDQVRREYSTIYNQQEYIRRENEELRRKLEDFDKVSKIQRNISTENSNNDQELKTLQARIISLEKSRKADVSECKLLYENQLSILHDELKSLHNQITRAKREKTTYKHMLEGAQRTIMELKSGKSPTGDRSAVNDNEQNSTMRQQMNTLEDELSEARLQISKMKTELISERSTLEIKTSELQSKINELEEEKILSSGRTKIVGLRTRMELSWQKEREEQQRLLQETATLARDLRQTLFEVERERDKERLESMRKLDLLKKTFDEEQDESRRKLKELQCDLLELRDAHAKLRTTNEKLRREKDRDRESRLATNGNKSRIVVNEGDRLRSNIAYQMDQLTQLAPDLFSRPDRSAGQYTPVAPRRTKSKSRESSPGLGIGGSRESLILPEDRRTQVQQAFLKLTDMVNQLKREQGDDKSAAGSAVQRRYMPRASSIESDSGIVTKQSAAMRNSSQYRTINPLHRKSLSLEQSKFLEDDRPIIAGSERSLDSDMMSSAGSLYTPAASSVALNNRNRRDASLDSRLSAGSTQSDVGDKKKKKSIMGKLKKLTKARSIDDEDPEIFGQSHSLRKEHSTSSDMNEAKGSKRDLKNRFTDMFKRRGSRSDSMERHINRDYSSTQRPLMPNSSSNVS